MLEKTKVKGVSQAFQEHRKKSQIYGEEEAVWRR